MESHLWKKGLVLLVLAFMSAGSSVAQSADRGVGAGPPKTYCLAPARLVESKRRIARGDESLKPAMDRLIAEADEALKVGPFSVMDKKLTASSGDKHDYMSLGVYWWPDPKKSDGLPYIRRDGEWNPKTQTNATDRESFGQLSSVVETLAIASYFTEDRRYAERVRELLRVWFLDTATKMNPHLQFGQGIPGRTEGRAVGIIDTEWLPGLIDAIALLETSGVWTQEDQVAMQAWCRAYLEWLRTSKHGLREEKAPNNHGTWYDAQMVSLALYVGRVDLAKEILEKVKTRRIEKHIEPDGSQPAELARTRPLHYSRMNLNGLFLLAEMGRKVDVDLWGYESSDGRSLRKALDFLAPYGDPIKKRPFKQISSYRPVTLFSLLRRGAIAYEDGQYEAFIEKIGVEDIAGERTNLLWPR